MNKLKNLLPYWPSALSWVLSLAAAAVGWLQVERSAGQENYVLLALAPQYLLLGVLTIFSVHLLVYALCGRRHIATAAGGLIVTVYALVNYYVKMLHGTAIMALDIANIATAVDAYSRQYAIPMVEKINAATDIAKRKIVAADLLPYKVGSAYRAIEIQKNSAAIHVHSELLSSSKNSLNSPSDSGEREFSFLSSSSAAFASGKRGSAYMERIKYSSAAPISPSFCEQHAIL